MNGDAGSIKPIPHTYFDPYTNGKLEAQRDEELAIIKEAERKRYIRNVVLIALGFIAFLAICILFRIYIIK